jgi:hypothetical protein
MMSGSVSYGHVLPPNKKGRLAIQTPFRFGTK